MRHPNRITIRCLHRIWPLGLVFLLCAFLNVSVVDDVPPQTPTPKEAFTFITYEAAPWQTTEPDGSATGMVPFILKNMSDAAGYTLTSVSYPYARMSRQIKRGNADLVISMTNANVKAHTIPCVHFGAFTVVVYTKNKPFLPLLMEKKKPSVGILNDSYVAFNELIPEHINRYWNIKDYSTEANIFNAVNKGRLDAGILSLNTYQLLSQNMGAIDKNVGFTTNMGYGHVTGWLPKHLKNSPRHMSMCDALNKVSDNGLMILDSDMIIDTLITQETPDITKTPRLTQKDIRAKDIIPQLIKIYSK